MSKNKYSSSIHRRAWLRLLAGGFIVYAVAVGLSGLRLSASAIHNAEPFFILLALVAIVLSYVFAAVTYMLLAPKVLQFIPTLFVQIAGGLVNRMLPAGLGGMGLNVFYLKKNGHSVSVATAVAATNNSIGFIGNVLVVAISLLIVPVDISELAVPAVPWPFIIGIVALMGTGCILIARHRSWARSVRRSFREIARYLVQTLNRPGKSLMALGSSCLLTALHGLGLFFVLQAVGGTQNWTIALLAISVGAFVGAATPTPGGLGGTEAGIAAVLMAFSLSVNMSVAAALIYRGITYWLPLLPGYFALKIVEKRYL